MSTIERKKVLVLYLKWLNETNPHCKSFNTFIKNVHQCECGAIVHKEFCFFHNQVALCEKCFLDKYI